MNECYTRRNWEDSPSTNTPINADNLNAMDLALHTIDDRVIEHESNKLFVTDAQNDIVNVSFAEDTGIFTFTRRSGATITLDTLLEKIVTNWDYDETTQKIVLTTKEGTKYIDISSMIQTNDFADSDTIAFTVTSGTVTAKVKNASITGDMLEPNYLANVTTQAENASTSAAEASTSAKAAANSAAEANAYVGGCGQIASIVEKMQQAAATSETNAASSASSASTSADNSSSSATLAKSYAVGGTSSRQGEDVDNAKYYMEQCKDIAGGDYVTRTEFGTLIESIGSMVSVDEETLIIDTTFAEDYILDGGDSSDD